MARSNPRWAGGARRTGVVRGSILGRRARSSGGSDWLALVFVAGLAVIVLLAVSSILNGTVAPPSASPRSSAVAVGDASASPETTDESSLPPFSPEATATARPTPSPSTDALTLADSDSFSDADSFSDSDAFTHSDSNRHADASTLDASRFCAADDPCNRTGHRGA